MKCRDLILHDFVLMLTDKDYSQLSSDPATAESMFNDLYDEYQQLMNTPGHGYLLTMLNELVELKSRYVAAQASLAVLVRDYDDQIVNILKDMGYPFDAENYLQSINRIERKLKTVRLNIDRKLIEYENAVKKMQGDQNTYQDYIKLLAVLSNTVGFALNIKSITVADFAAYYELHTAKIKANARN